MISRNIASPTLNRRISVISISSLFCLATAVSLVAWAATPAEVQKARHEHYEKLGDAFKTVRDNAKEGGDFAAVEKAAITIEQATRDQMQWFPAGSGPEAGKTRAMAEIWTKPSEFAAAQKMFAERAPALTAAAKAKDLDAMRKAFREVGGACKNCHDNFRAPE